MTTLVVVVLLAAMWAAVLLPPYIRDRKDGSAARGGVVGDRVNALSSMRSHAGHLPVRSGAADPRATPLPAGARQPIGAGTGSSGTGHLVPQSSAVSILGREDGLPVTRPQLHAVTDEEAEVFAAEQAAEPVPVVQATPVPSRSGTTAAKQRRKDVLMALGAAAGLTLVAGLALGGPMLYLHLMVDAALAGYVYLLVQHRKTSVESEMKVAFLPNGGSGPDARAMLAEGGGFAPGAPVEARVPRAQAN